MNGDQWWPNSKIIRDTSVQENIKKYKINNDKLQYYHHVNRIKETRMSRGELKWK